MVESRGRSSEGVSRAAAEAGAGKKTPWIYDDSAFAGSSSSKASPERFTAVLGPAVNEWSVSLGWLGASARGGQ
jgi:hypothetical protein